MFFLSPASFSPSELQLFFLISYKGSNHKPTMGLGVKSAGGDTFCHGSHVSELVYMPELCGWLFYTGAVFLWILIWAAYPTTIILTICF